MASGKSLKAHNEIHLLEYNQHLGAMACHQICTTAMVIHKLGEDKETQGTYFVAGREGGHEKLCVARVGIESLRDVTAKEALYKQTKDALGSKAALKVTSEVVLPFRVRE